MSYLIQNEVIKDLDQQAQTNYRNKILSQKDLYDVLPFGKTKIQQLIASNQLPLLKIGKDYVTTYNILEDWIREHIGDEIRIKCYHYTN